MNLDERLADLAGPQVGVDHQQVIGRSQSRTRRRRRAIAAVLSITVAAIGTLVVVARDPDSQLVATDPEPTSSPGAAQTSSMPEPLSAMTPDGLHLEWVGGEFNFETHEPGEVFTAEGVRINYELDDGERGEASAPVTRSSSGSPVHVGASWGQADGLWFVAVRTDARIATMRLVLPDGRVDSRDPATDLTVFAGTGGPSTSRLEAFDAQGELVVSCVAVSGATGCN